MWTGTQVEIAHDRLRDCIRQSYRQDGALYSFHFCLLELARTLFMTISVFKIILSSIRDISTCRKSINIGYSNCQTIGFYLGDRGFWTLTCFHV